jgi:hypothetical protein
MNIKRNGILMHLQFSGETSKNIFVQKGKQISKGNQDEISKGQGSSNNQS